MAGEYRNFVANGFIVHNCGKTVTTVAACDRSRARRILVVCPAVVRRFWENTFLTWQTIDRPVTCIEGYVNEPLPNGVSIVSHECLADVPPPPGSKKRRVENYATPMLQQSGTFDCIILDEAHMFREASAQRASAFYAPCGLWEQARQVFALTGTPIVNSAADLWLPIFGPLRTPISWWDWTEHFSAEIRNGQDSVRPIGVKNTDELADFLRPHALRRTLESLNINLPPLITEQVPLSLPEEALDEALEGLKKWTPARLQMALERDDSVQDAALAKVRHALGIAKAPYAAQHIEDILRSNDGPVVAFFQHTKVRELLYQYLSDQGYRVSWIDGTVTRPQLRAAQEYFQAGQIDVLLVQTQAGGVGITLHRAHRCVQVELPWTSVAVEQAQKRIHRIGQVNPCKAEVLRAEDCWLDDIMASIVARKQAAADGLLARLTTDR